MVETVRAWLDNRDFESLYAAVHDLDDLSQEDKQALLPYILELVTEIVHEHIVDHTKMNFDAKSEHFMLRFLYEDAMNYYEIGELYEAKEAFSLLSALCDSKHFEKSLKKHVLALLEDVDFDTFITTWVQAKDLKHFYISSFTKEVEKKYKDKSSDINDAVAQYRKLFR